MVHLIVVGPYRVPLLHLATGPEPNLDGAAEAEPLAALLNECINNHDREAFTRAVRQRGAMCNYMSSVGAALSSDEERSLTEDWLEKTGESLQPCEIARVGMMGHAVPLAVSWASLQAALSELVQLRAREATRVTIEGVEVQFRRSGKDVLLDRTLEPMTSILNNIRSGMGRKANRARYRREFREALVRRERFHVQGLYCSHRSSFADDDEAWLAGAGSAWRDYAGADPGLDSYCMGYTYENHPLLVPTSLLLTLWQELERFESRQER